jgi:hypothetical protein
MNTALNLVGIHLIIHEVLISAADVSELNRALVILEQIPVAFSELRPHIVAAQQSNRLQ